MSSEIKTYERTIITELAEAISSFNTARVAALLSDEGKYAVQNSDFRIVITDKSEFIRWLKGCFSKILFAGKFRRRLSFTIVQGLHCVTANPIIIFERGRFPVFSGNQAKNEQSGLVIKSEENKITGIELCFLVMKMKSPFIYEKRCLNPDS